MLQFVCDQNVPAPGHRGVLQDWVKSGNPAETRGPIENTAHHFEFGINSAGHEPAGWNWHPLKGELEGHWAVNVSGNWRLTFSFEGEDAILVDYQDYH